MSSGTKRRRLVLLAAGLAAGAGLGAPWASRAHGARAQDARAAQPAEAPAEAPADTVGVTASAAREQLVTDTAVAELARTEARYRAAIALDPSVGAYHASLAVVLMRQGRLADARQSAAAAVRLDPTSPRNRSVFGEVLLEQGRWADAESQLEQVVRYGGVDGLTLERLARAYAEQAKWPAAAAAYAEALRVEPGSQSARDGYLAALEHIEGAPPALDLEIEWQEPAGAPPAILWILRVLSGVLLVGAAFGLLYPLAGFVYVVLVLVPLRLARRLA